MAELYKAKYPVTRVVYGVDGTPVTVKNKKGKLVAKREVVRDEQGKPIYRETKKWCISYVDADGRPRRVMAFTDKKASEQRKAEIERQVERQRAGIVDIDIQQMRKPLEGVIAAYVADLERAGRDAEYTYIVGRRLNKLRKECGWATLASIDARSLNNWLRGLAANGAAPRTANQYIATAVAFCNWAVRERRLETNPLSHVARADGSAKKRKRRALTLQELDSLLRAAGPRSIGYLAAVLTGLRRSELDALQWGDVILDDGRPRIELRPEATKSKRADVIDLPQELVDALMRHRPAGAQPTDLVFPAGVPSMKVHKRLLRKAGIDYEDSQKRKADFHALRKTYNMLLARAGVPLQTRMFLMRHTDPKLTADTYADINVLNPAGAVQGLPRLMPQPVREELRATGTDGRCIEPTSKTRSRNLSSCLSKPGSPECAQDQNEAGDEPTLPQVHDWESFAPSVVNDEEQELALACASGVEEGEIWAARTRT